MALSDLFEGEGRLLGALGANVTLGGVRAADKSLSFLDSLMPCLDKLLMLAQIAVALATLVYMILKIRRVWKKEKTDEL